VPPKPCLERNRVELPVPAPELALGDEPGEPGALRDRQRREAQEVADPVQRMETAVDVETHPRRREFERISETELVSHREHSIVRGDDHMIEAVDDVTPEVHRGSQAADARPAFEERHIRAGLGQPVCKNRPEDSSPDDADSMWPHRGSTGATGASSGGRLLAAR